MHAAGRHSSWRYTVSDMTSKKSRRHNALLHGVHSRDIILPGERSEDLDAVLTNTRLEFGLRGTTQDETVSGIAGLRWTARRINRLCQHAFVELARELEKSGKRSVDDSRRSRRVEKRRGKVNDTNAVVQLSEAFALIARTATIMTMTTTTKLIQMITIGSTNTTRQWQNKKRRAEGIAPRTINRSNTQGGSKVT
jgi:hypothetical protein